MTPDRWQKVKTLYESAMERPAGERAGFIRDACVEDTSLCAEVKSLIAARHRVGDFLQVSASPDASPTDGQAAADAALGRRIGAYTLIRVLGHGGMGTVYEAAQDGPKRRVALKVVRGGAYVDDHVVRLFRREVQALALLNHPNIAALYEAGRTDDGQHYFAMELVDGVPLTAYVKQQNAPLPDRLDLFIRVCEGIAFAHQRGVIHRDLKPSNILVVDEATEALRHEGAKVSPGGTSALRASVPSRLCGSPKILDFGLAKITDADLALTTLTRDTGKIQGTLAYMSPEQARGQSDAIDLRSDIYSLGVLLYGLLTGELPYDVRSVPLPHAVRMICDEPPDRPSNKNRVLRGDLETIVLKALEKEPARRYQSASALADDLRQFRDGQPISARPPSASYQLKKLIGRHKLPAALVAVLFIIISVFASTMSVLYGHSSANLRRAVSAERDARDETEKYSEFAEYLLNLIEHSSPRSADDIANETWSYVLQGKPLPPALRELVGTRRTALLAELDNPGDHLSLAVPLTNIGNLLRGGGEFLAAEDLFSRSEAIMRTAPERFGYYLSYPISSVRMIRAYQGRMQETAELARKYYRVRLERLGPNDYETIRAMSDLGGMLLFSGEFDEAERLLREALPFQERAAGRDNEFVGYCAETLGAVLHIQGKYAEAKPILQRSFELRRAWFAEDAPMVTRPRIWLSACMLRLGQRQQAEDHLRHIPPNSRIIQISPFWKLAIGEIVRFYRDIGEPQRARELLGDYVDVAIDVPRQTPTSPLSSVAEESRGPGPLHALPAGKSVTSRPDERS